MPIKTKKELQAQGSLDDFISGAKASAAEEVKRPLGRPANPDSDQWIRQTFLVRVDHVETLRRAAYWDRVTIKEVLDDALTAYFQGKSYEPVPQRERQ